MILSCISFLCIFLWLYAFGISRGEQKFIGFQYTLPNGIYLLNKCFLYHQHPHTTIYDTHNDDLYKPIDDIKSIYSGLHWLLELHI